MDRTACITATLHLHRIGNTYRNNGRALAIVRTPTDIFPNIDIPVVSIIWSYSGLVPEDMADRIVTIGERSLTTTVTNIEHIESQSLYGVAVGKVLLQPNANIEQGIAQITAVSGDPAKATARRNDASGLGL